VTALAQSAINYTRMSSYIQSYATLQPANQGQLFDRAMYVVCTQNTGTRLSLRQYEHVSTVPWTTKDELEQAMAAGGGGLSPQKASTCWNIYTAMCEGLRLGHPTRDMGIAEDDPAGIWHKAREKLDAISGLGLKLSSLILHVTCPFECKLLVLDTWFARQGWYDIKPSKRGAYLEAEQHWLSLCERKGWQYPSIAREILWSTIGQKRVLDADDTWWTYALRLEQTSPLIQPFRSIAITPRPVSLDKPA